MGPFTVCAMVMQAGGSRAEEDSLRGLALEEVWARAALEASPWLPGAAETSRTVRSQLESAKGPSGGGEDRTYRLGRPPQQFHLVHKPI